MLPTSAGVEPATSWCPVGRRIQLSHRGRQFKIDFQHGLAARATILDFRSEWFKLFFIHKSSCYFLSSFESMGLSVQEEKFIDFKIATVAAILYYQSERFSLFFFFFFYLQVTLMLSTMFRVNWPFGWGEEAKIDFQDRGYGGYLEFSIGRSLAIFIYVTLMLPIKFQVNLRFGLAEEAKRDFQDGLIAAILDIPLDRFLLYLIY